eukprot:2444772-Amphidinium_carterae.1
MPFVSLYVFVSAHCPSLVSSLRLVRCSRCVLFPSCAGDMDLQCSRPCVGCFCLVSSALESDADLVTSRPIRPSPHTLSTQAVQRWLPALTPNLAQK